MSKSGITLSNHNRKIVGANIFNLPVGITCKPGVLCSTYCYAKKAERTYPGVRPARMRNYAAAQSDHFILDMVTLLNKSKYKVTRIHEGGDFFSIEYILKWYRIAERLPKHKFYAYTKRDDLFTTELLGDKPDNLTLIYSIDGVQDLKTFDLYNEWEGWDKIAIVTEHKTNCPSSASSEKKCVRDCKKCFDNKTQVITFARH